MLNQKVIYTETKFSVKFQIKDETNDEHKHDFACYGKCPECDKSYVEETRRRPLDRFDDYSGIYSKNNILKLSEVLCTKELRPPLNTKET